METKLNDEATKRNEEIDVKKRAFMEKFGKYTVAGVGAATLMTPTLSTAGNYKSPDDNSQHYPNTTNHDSDNFKDALRPDGDGGFVPPGQTK